MKPTKSAAKKLNIHRCGICACLNGIQKSTKGYYFKFK